MKMENGSVIWKGSTMGDTLIFSLNHDYGRKVIVSYSLDRDILQRSTFLNELLVTEWIPNHVLIFSVFFRGGKSSFDFVYEEYGIFGISFWDPTRIPHGKFVDCNRRYTPENERLELEQYLPPNGKGETWTNKTTNSWGIKGKYHPKN